MALGRLITLASTLTLLSHSALVLSSSPSGVSTQRFANSIVTRRRDLPGGLRLPRWAGTVRRKSSISSEALPDISGGGGERAVFGGGCFWCIEAVFQQLKGVKAVTSGYAGGGSSNPSYEEVCSGKSGHAEVVAIDFNPREIDYKDLLDVFWAAHDATTKNRQGADVGTQYRSSIFYTTERQRKLALQSMASENERLSGRKLLGCIPVPGQVTTELEPLERFWTAEKYHQNYFRKAPYVPYCAVNIAPKVAKIKGTFPKLLASAFDEDV